MTGFAAREDRRTEKDNLAPLRESAEELYDLTGIAARSDEYFGIVMGGKNNDPKRLLIGKMLDKANQTLGYFSDYGQYPNKNEDDYGPFDKDTYPYFNTAEQVGLALDTVAQHLRETEFWDEPKLQKFDATIATAKEHGLFDSSKIAALTPQKGGPAG